MAFKQATREKSKLRLAIDGPTGSGKTLTALRMGMEIARHEAAKMNRQPRVAFIDTEYGTARKYVGDVHDGFPINFDVDELSSFSPTNYTTTVFNAARGGYDVVIIDSLSHAWNGTDGALALVDKKAGASGNSYTAWKDVTPLQNQMIEAIIRCPIHVIATMRSKMEYVIEVNERGRSVPRKVGLAPIQRQGVEYEFDVMIDMDTEHIATMAKTRCSAIDGKVVEKPGAELMKAIIYWLEQGSDIPQEMLDVSRLVDPVDVPAAGAQQSAVVGTDEMAARMAAKRAAMGVASPTAAATPTSGVTTNEPSPLVETAAKNPVQVTTASTAQAEANSTSGAAAAVTTPAPQSPIMVEISKLFDQLGAPAEARKSAFEKRGAKRLEELSVEASENLLAALQLMAAGKAPAVTVAQVAPAVVATAATPVVAAPVTTPADPAMITGVQQDEIRKLFEQLGVPPEARVMAYQKRGANALAELTAERSVDLIHSLKGRLTGLDQLSAFQPTVPDKPEYATAEQKAAVAAATNGELLPEDVPF